MNRHVITQDCHHLIIRFSQNGNFTQRYVFYNVIDRCEWVEMCSDNRIDAFINFRVNDWKVYVFASFFIKDKFFKIK